jgi:hypothetical protein
MSTSPSKLPFLLHPLTLSPATSISKSVLCVVDRYSGLWSRSKSVWRQIERSRVPLPALPHFLRSTESEAVSTQPRDDNWGTKQKKKLTNFVALSPRANSTDWVTATCRRDLVPTFVDRGVSRGQRGGSPTVVNLGFLDRSRHWGTT